MIQKVKNVTTHALDSLQITNGASHTEVKIDSEGVIRIIEIGGRMGGDCIGSSLVQLSTGVDFVKAVIEIALGENPLNIEPKNCGAAGVHFIFDQNDLNCLDRLRKEHPEWLVEASVGTINSEKVSDSSHRFGYFVFAAKTARDIEPYLPASEY